MEQYKIVKHTNAFFNLNKFIKFKKTMSYPSSEDKQLFLDDDRGPDFSPEDKQLFSDNVNILLKDPYTDTIYINELKETLTYFSKFYKLKTNYSYQCNVAGSFLPWHTDKHMDEIGCIIIPMNVNGKGTCETHYENEIFYRSYTETVVMNTLLKHKTVPTMSDYTYLRIPIQEVK